MGKTCRKGDMVKKIEAPKQGSIYMVSLDPTLGHEEQGARPVLVISSTKYNNQSGIALVCPITSRQKGYPFEVICNTSKVKGVILVDQIRTLDWHVRNFIYMDDIDLDVFKEVRLRLHLLIS